MTEATIDDPVFGEIRIGSPEQVDALLETVTGMAEDTNTRAQAARSAMALTSEPLASACADAADYLSSAAVALLEGFHAARSGDTARWIDALGVIMKQSEKAARTVEAAIQEERGPTKDKDLRRAREKASKVCQEVWKDLRLADHRCSRAMERVNAGVPPVDCLISIKDCHVSVRLCLEAVLALMTPKRSGIQTWPLEGAVTRSPWHLPGRPSQMAAGP